MSETGYLVSPIYDQEVTDDLVENCRALAREQAEREGAVLSSEAPRVTHLTYPNNGGTPVRCLRFEMTR